jgi:hypothetical protein
MRWLAEESAFQELLLEAKTLVFIDSGREPTVLQRLVFDDAQLCTADFANLLQSLMRLSGGSRAYYLVLRPDPIHYFHEHFKKYPLLQIDRDDSAKTYLAALNEDPGGSPADAVGINWSAAVIFPPGTNWFIHLVRSATDNGGHLWVPRDWTEKIVDGHRYLRTEPFGRVGPFSSAL